MLAKAPQLAGRAVLVDNEKLLLVRGDGDGSFWTLPGGRSDLGEDIRACVEREVYEETGYKVRAHEFFTSYEFYDEAQSFHVLNMLFHCTLQESLSQKEWKDQGGGVQESRFFSVAEIQALPIVFPEFLRNGEWLEQKQNNYYRGFERLKRRA